MSCPTIQIIQPTECIGNSLVKINSNFTALSGSVCGKVDLAGDIMYGNLDLGCNKLQHFGVDIKEVTLTSATSFKYTIQPDDCGRVIIVNSTQAGTVGVLPSLPVGFNIMIVNNSTFNIEIIPNTVSNGVSINNIDNKTKIRDRYGICNFICYRNNNILISGDLV